MDEAGVSDLLVAQRDFVESFCEYYRQGKYDGILFLGDWTDDSTIDPVVQRYSNECLKMLNRCDGKKIAITGNHTVYDKGNEFTVFSAASEAFDNVKFVNNAEIIDYEGIRFHCLPYNSNYSNIEQKIEEYSMNIDYGKVNVLLFHFPLKGAKLDNGLESKDGVRYIQSDFDEFDLVLGGDFHRRQHIGQDTYYVGAPFDLKFGEHQTRGFTELTIDDVNGEYEMDLIENPFQYNLKTVNSKEELGEVTDKDIIRFKGDFDTKDKNDLRNFVKGSDCYGYQFSIVNNADDTENVLDNFESLSGGGNYSIVKNHLNNLDISDGMLDDCLDILDKVV